MSKVLRIWEEGQVTLYLVASDTWPAIERHFTRHPNTADGTLQICSTVGHVLETLDLNRDEWSAIDRGYAHWLECQGDTLAMSLIIRLS